MLKHHLIKEDPGGARAEIVMACGKRGRIRNRFSTHVEGDTWKGFAVAPSGFTAVTANQFFPDRYHCEVCKRAWMKGT